MKKFSTIAMLMGAGLAGAILFGPSATAQNAIKPVAATAPAPKKPTSATPQMIEEAIQRSQARSAKMRDQGVPERWGSEEPFTYVPGKTF